MVDPKTFSLITIAIVVFIDLFARWLAYRKIDSICLDICIFSFVYQFSVMFSKTPISHSDLIKLGALLILFAVVALIHGGLLGRTQDKAKYFYSSPKISSDVGQHIETISTFLLEVDLSEVKGYKKKARESLKFILKSFGVDVPEGDPFILDRKLRKWIRALFFSLRVFAVAIVWI